jgi:hypothetical protein
MNRAVSVVVVLFQLCLASHVAAQVPDIPTALEPWKAWVLHDNTEWPCPPSLTMLRFAAAGGRHG